MGKKKVKPNAFSEFMFEFISKERRLGRNHPKEQWAIVAKPHWERLSQSQKDNYKARAKSKPTKTVNVAPKYTSQGIPLDVIERENRERFEKQKHMERSIKNWVSLGFQNNDINAKPMMFIMANYFYKTHDLVYSPAEIAVGKFTMENGLQKYYHSFVNPDLVKVGYAFETKDYSERIHRIPPPGSPDAMGEKDYNKIYAGILDVIGIETDEKYEKHNILRPCLYVRKDDIEMIESVLDQLSFDMKWREKFDIFELELLFNELKNAIDLDPETPAKKYPISVTSYYIESDQFFLTRDISCNFHEEIDAPNRCALSYIRRWFFTFADHCAEKIGVTIVPGKHLPKTLILNDPNADEWNENGETSKYAKKVSNIRDNTYTIGYEKLEEEFSSESDEA